MVELVQLGIWIWIYSEALFCMQDKVARLIIGSCFKDKKIGKVASRVYK